MRGPVGVRALPCPNLLQAFCPKRAFPFLDSLEGPGVSLAPCMIYFFLSETGSSFF